MSTAQRSSRSIITNSRVGVGYGCPGYLKTVVEWVLGLGLIIVELIASPKREVKLVRWGRTGVFLLTVQWGRLKVVVRWKATFMAFLRIRPSHQYLSYWMFRKPWLLAYSSQTSAFLLIMVRPMIVCTIPFNVLKIAKLNKQPAYNFPNWISQTVTQKSSSYTLCKRPHCLEIHR